MFPDTNFSKLVRIQFPIIQAPMAGGPTTPELVAAVSNSGAPGSFGAAVLAPEAIRQVIEEIRTRTKKPFNVNLFVLEKPNPDARQVARALELLGPIRAELGMPPGTVPQKFGEDSENQFRALLEAAPPVASFTFGILTREQVAALKSRGSLVIGSATTVAEAKAWEAVGADAVCAQGSEAGGHRGTFLGDFESAMVGSMALIPQIVDAVRVPVIAAGGIMDGRGIAAALMLGASAAQLGTAFLTCPEAGVSATWKTALRNAKDTQTMVTRAFTGRPARGIANEFMLRLRDVQDEFPSYLIQGALTGPIRQAAAKANRPEFTAMWAGQGAGMSRDLPAAELVAKLVQETKKVLSDVSR